MEMLTGWLGGLYMPFKAAHASVTFFWIAGLFMLPRYLAYQAQEAPGTEQDRKWAERTGKLRKIILTPAMLAVWVLGLMVATSYGMAGAGWIHTKIALALLLTGYHGWMVGISKQMAAGQRPMTEKKLRLWNEVPALATLLFVFLAILKPF